MQVDPAALERNLQTNVMAFLHLARRAAPAMIQAGTGAIVATSNTSALRGKCNFAAFAPTKAAQRILAESMPANSDPRCARGLCLNRCCDRHGADPSIASGRTRRPLHSTRRHRWLNLARSASTAKRLVLQRRDPTFQRDLVRVAGPVVSNFGQRPVHAQRPPGAARGCPWALRRLGPLLTAQPRRTHRLRASNANLYCSWQRARLAGQHELQVSGACVKIPLDIGECWRVGIDRQRPEQAYASQHDGQAAAAECGLPASGHGQT
jgi:hypothetical protein